MKIGDVFVIYDNQGEQGRVKITAIRSDHVVAEGVNGGSWGTRWTVVPEISDLVGDRLRSAKHDRMGNYHNAVPAGPWDARVQAQKDRDDVAKATMKDDATAAFLAQCARAKALLGCTLKDDNDNSSFKTVTSVLREWAPTASLEEIMSVLNELQKLSADRRQELVEKGEA